MSTTQKRTPTGIRARHSRTCASRDGRRCNCTPSYEAWAWSKTDQQKIRKTFRSLAEARAWRHDAAGAVRRGTLSAPSRKTLRESADELIVGMQDGTIRRRDGQPFKPSAIRGYRSDLTRFVLPELGAHRLADIRRSDLQRLVDDLVASGYSGSKVRNVITSVQTVYRVALRRDEVSVNATVGLELPAVGEPRDRVASPADAHVLLAALPEDDRALWGTAFFGGLRTRRAARPPVRRRRSGRRRDPRSARLG